MDPVTAVGLAGSAINIAGVLGRLVKTVNDLQTRFRHANLMLNLFGYQLDTLNRALDHMSSWNEGNCSQVLIDGSKSAIQGISLLVMLLEEKVQALQTKHGGRLTFQGKLTFMWSHAEMREYLNQLNGQIMALDVLRHAYTCPALSTQQAFMQDIESVEIIKTARDATSSLIANDDIQSRLERCSIVSTDTGSWSTEFDFDVDLTDSRVYQHALRSNMRKGNTSSAPSAEADTRLHTKGRTPDTPETNDNYNTLSPHSHMQEVSLDMEYGIEGTGRTRQSADATTTFPSSNITADTKLVENRSRSFEVRSRTGSLGQHDDNGADQSKEISLNCPKEDLDVRLDGDEEDDWLDDVTKEALTLAGSQSSDTRPSPPLKQKDQRQLLPQHLILPEEIPKPVGVQRESINIILLGSPKARKSMLTQSLKNCSDSTTSINKHYSSIWRDDIRYRVISEFQVLIEEITEEMCWPKSISLPQRQEFCAWLANVGDVYPAHLRWTSFSPEKLALMRQIWDDDCIWDVLVDRGRDYKTHIDADRWIPDLERIFQPDWVPSNRDILLSRSSMTHVKESIIPVVGRDLRVLETEGTRLKRAQWNHVLVTVNIAIHVVDFVALEVALQQNKGSGKFADNFSLWQIMVASDRFREKGFIVAFAYGNLREVSSKMRQQIKAQFNDFDTNRYRYYEEVCQFLIEKLLALRKDHWPDRCIKAVGASLSGGSSQFGRELLEAMKELQCEMSQGAVEGDFS